MMKSHSTRTVRGRRMIAPLALGVAALLLASCSAGTTADPEAAEAAAENPLYESAREEGSLTWYTSLDTGTAEATIETFQEAYPGVTVQLQRLTTGQITARYSEERTAGSSPADVVTVGDPGFFEAAREKDWFETDPELPALEDWPADYYNDGVALLSMIPLGITYNTNQVDSPPKTWEDVLDSEYTGKIQLGDPRNVPAYLQLYALLLDEYGDGFLADLAAQKPTIFPSIVNATQTVASGGALLATPGTNPTTLVVKAEGAPIDFVALSPTVGVEFYSAIAKKSQHPNAGALFTDFLLTPEGQEAVSVNTVSPLEDIPGTQPMPEGYQRIETATAQKQLAVIVKELGIE